jgi:hypothetical protein
MTLLPIDFLQRLELGDHKDRDVSDGQSVLDSSTRKTESMGALTTSIHLVMSTEERKRSRSQHSVLDDRFPVDRSSSELAKAVDAYFAIEYRAVT